MRQRLQIWTSTLAQKGFLETLAPLEYLFQNPKHRHSDIVERSYRDTPFGIPFGYVWSCLTLVEI